MHQLSICSCTDPCLQGYPVELNPIPAGHWNTHPCPMGPHTVQPANVQWCPAVNQNFYFLGSNSALGTNVEKTIQHQKSQTGLGLVLILEEVHSGDMIMLI